MSFWDTLSSILDVALAPAGAFDSASAMHCDEQQQFSEPAWHNAFGTQTDYSVGTNGHDGMSAGYGDCSDGGFGF